MITKMRKSCWQVKPRVEALVPVDVIDNPNLHSFFFTCDDNFVVNVIKHLFYTNCHYFEFETIHSYKKSPMNNFNFVLLLFAVDVKNSHYP